jgi:hypothetical protein
MRKMVGEAWPFHREAWFWIAQPDFATRCVLEVAAWGIAPTRPLATTLICLFVKMAFNLFR